MSTFLNFERIFLRRVNLFRIMKKNPLFWNESILKVHCDGFNDSISFVPSVAVVVAFFVCWAPFHTQRLWTIYMKKEHWTTELLELQNHVFFLSGLMIFPSLSISLSINLSLIMSVCLSVFLFRLYLFFSVKVFKK